MHVNVRLAYGKNGLVVKIPDHVSIDVRNPEHVNGIKDISSVVNQALDDPVGTQRLETIIERLQVTKQGRIKACIVVSDHTRPVPTALFLGDLLQRLIDSGMNSADITILVATGLHRPSTKNELERIVGPDVLDSYQVICHDATNHDDLENLGKSSRGTPIQINKLYLDADLKIITGYVDPHFFAGYAGGRKSIVPGIAGDETIIANHSAEFIQDSNARFLVLDGNPIHEDALEIAKLVGVDFTLNVCLNDSHEIIKMAAGDMEAVHESLVQFLKPHVTCGCIDTYDIVIVNNGGYPLDLNLYQSVKSMAIGELVVKPRGTIIATNELSDGFGGGEEFKQVLENEDDPNKLIEKLLTREMVIPSQWQVQILARILQKATIRVVSSMALENFKEVFMGINFHGDFSEALDAALEKHGNGARILVLPAGPQLIPCLEQ
ncbi:nickel-dependent lactate racemase [Candidatus Bathyarchaeota archaeon]|nr:nickel-dependent lactate racemase [Candidatus Bathyarchaeota archaeon]